MNVSPKIAVGGSLLVVAVAVVVLSMNAAERRIALPKEFFVCGNASCGHSWTQELTNEPICPKCGSPGAKEARYRCGACGETFTAWYTRQVSIGRFELLLPGASEWTRTPPGLLKCPNCGVVDRLGEGNFQPAGFVPRGDSTHPLER